MAVDDLLAFAATSAVAVAVSASVDDDMRSSEPGPYVIVAV